ALGRLGATQSGHVATCAPCRAVVEVLGRAVVVILATTARSSAPTEYTASISGAEVRAWPRRRQRQRAARTIPRRSAVGGSRCTCSLSIRSNRRCPSCGPLVVERVDRIPPRIRPAVLDDRGVELVLDQLLRPVLICRAFRLPVPVSDGSERLEVAAERTGI